MCVDDHYFYLMGYLHCDVSKMDNAIFAWTQHWHSQSHAGLGMLLPKHPRFGGCCSLIVDAFKEKEIVTRVEMPTCFDD